MAELKTILIGSLKPHPDNPRLMLREDVVEGIVTQLKASGSFSEMHAPIVRAVNGHYQIISGHHRIEAGKRSEFESLPCWVAEMDDEEAFMQLVLSNTQGELSPLEIGIHAFKAVPLQKNGGLSAYAQRIGKNRQYISELRNAANVVERTNKTAAQAAVLLDKAKHLAAIHSAPESLWETLVKSMLKNEWSASDTEHWVKKVNEFVTKKKGTAIDDRWVRWLPLDEIVAHFLATKEFSPATVSKLIQLAESIEATIRAYEHAIDADSYLAAFRSWLESGRKDRSTWDARNLIGYQRKLMAELEHAEMEAAKRWNHGNWRDFVGDLQDESIHLLLTDPPYGIGFQSNYKLDRREERNHQPIANDGVGDALVELSEMLDAFIPKMADNAHALIFCHWSKEPEFREIIKASGLQIRGSLIWVKNNTGMGDLNTTFAPQHERILHAVKGSPVLLKRHSDVLAYNRINASNHPTEKPTDLLSALIEATTTEGEFVADPFAGLASSLVAAKILKRNYWGCEIEELYHRLGGERLEGAVGDGPLH